MTAKFFNQEEEWTRSRKEWIEVNLLRAVPK